MAPDSKIYLTRHAQAEHNVDLDYTILDAPLTPLGKNQASSLAHLLPSSIRSSIDLIVTSPLTRTLQTTLLAYAPVIDRLGGPSAIITLPEAQECNDFPCDTGSSRSTLESNPDFDGIDFSALPEDWTSKRGRWAADPEALRLRARAVREFLLSRPEQHIVLVAHGDVLRRITATAEGPGTYMWRNAEMRVYRFEEESVGGEAFLQLEEVVEATGGYPWKSTWEDVPEFKPEGDKADGETNGHANGTLNGKM